MTRVLVVSHSSVVGLYQGKLHCLARDHGAEVMLVVPPRWKEGGNIVAAETGLYPNITTRSLPVVFGGIASMHVYNPFALGTLVRSFAPDIIYAEEEPWSFAALQLLQIAHRRKIPFIFYTWENIWCRYNVISEWVLSRVLRYADGAVAGNEEAREILTRRGFARPITCIAQYGIDVEFFQRRQDAPAELAGLRRPIVAYIGRLVAEKNVDLLIEAALRLRDAAAFLIVGEGPQKNGLVALARRYGLQGQITFINAIPYDDIPRYLSAVDMVVLPSKTTPAWKEQFGRILVEAMACGVGVIGSDSGSIPWVIGDAGLVFREGDVESLVAQLQAALRTQGSLRTLGERGVVRARQCFSNDVIARKLHEFLAQTIDDAHSPPP